MSKIYYQTDTTNISFMVLRNLLKSEGIKNNKFFLEIKDPTLIGVDPYDPNLNSETKQRIIKECVSNYWYYLREIVRVPNIGGSEGVQFKLHRGNLAINFCMINNLNTIAELSLQHGKNIAVSTRLSWEFLFGTNNSGSDIIGKTIENSKVNLHRIREICTILPDYIRFNNFKVDVNGKVQKYIDNYEKMECPLNRNTINVIPSRRYLKKDLKEEKSYNISPRIWYDDFTFISNIRKVYYNSLPKTHEAVVRAKNNNSPNGIVITTSPGDVRISNQQWVYNMINMATQFNDCWYDLSYDEIKELMDKNLISSFVYIKYLYNEMGTSEGWFKNMSNELRNDWADIQREILLVWDGVSCESSENTKTI